MDEYPMPEMFPVASSNISEMGYDDENEILYLTFLRKGNDFAERQYRFFNVPFDTYSQLFNVESIGSYFYHNIRNRPDLYPYERLL